MNDQRQLRNIALTGFLGTGKTAVGRILAGQLRFDFVDTDELIERRAGRTPGRIEAELGEPALRELERRVLEELKGGERTVIAAGASLGANPESVASLKEHALVVCLWASPESIYSRVKTQARHPLLQGPAPLDAIRQALKLRELVYRQADALVNSEWRSVKEVAQQVLYQFRLATAVVPS